MSMIALGGRLQLSDSHELEDLLTDVLSNGSQRLVLDLREVRYICSSALGVLLAARRRTAYQTSGLKLVVQEGEVLDLLRLTMVDKIFQIYRDAEGAIDSFAGDAPKRADN